MSTIKEIEIKIMNQVKENLIAQLAERGWHITLEEEYSFIISYVVDAARTDVEIFNELGRLIARSCATFINDKTIFKVGIFRYFYDDLDDEIKQISEFLAQTLTRYVTK